MMDPWKYIEEPITVVIPKCPECGDDLGMETVEGVLVPMKGVCEDCQIVYVVEWL